MSEARIWYSRHEDQCSLPGTGENVLVLTDEFYREVSAHPIPTDLIAARALSYSPAALDLFTWLSCRCFIAKREERAPLFGDLGPTQQLGVGAYNRTRKFRERLEEWLGLVKRMWLECPARISSDGLWLIVAPGRAVSADVAGIR